MPEPTPAQLGAILRCFGCGENRRWPGEPRCFVCQEHVLDDNPAPPPNQEERP